jgi:hypothetical protein
MCYNLMRTIQVRKGEPPMNRGWKTLKPGIKVLKLWETTGPKQPQIAILQLSSATYKDLQRDAKAFADSYMIFGERVRTGASLTELLSAPGGYSGDWTVTCFHRESMLRCASYPVEPSLK